MILRGSGESGLMAQDRLAEKKAGAGAGGRLEEGKWRWCL